MLLFCKQVNTSSLVRENIAGPHYEAKYFGAYIRMEEVLMIRTIGKGAIQAALLVEVPFLIPNPAAPISIEEFDVVTMNDDVEHHIIFKGHGLRGG